MSNDGDDGGIVDELLRDANGDVSPAAVVPDSQRELAAADPTARVDLFDRQLGGPLHRLAAGLRKRAGQSQDDWAPPTPAAAARAGGKGKDGCEQDQRGGTHSRARLRL